MAAGTVKWFKEKGYGFIVRDESGSDILVPYGGIAGEGFRDLAEGARVEFEVEQGRKGPQATNVRRRAH